MEELIKVEDLINGMDDIKAFKQVADFCEKRRFDLLTDDECNELHTFATEMYKAIEVCLFEGYLDGRC